MSRNKAMNNRGDTVISFKGHNQKERIFNPTVDGLTEKKLPSENLINLNRQGLKLTFSEKLFTQFKLCHGLFNTSRGGTLNFEYTGNTVQMIFQLKGSSMLDYGDTSYQFLEGEHNLLFRPSVRGTILLPQGISEVFLVDFSKEYFYNYLTENTVFKEFWQATHTGRVALFCESNMDISPSLRVLISDIMEFRPTDDLKKIALGAKILELLLAQLNIYKMESRKMAASPEQDKQKMNMVMDYIKTHYKKPMGLKYLASRVGTNEYALKKNFKAMFGNTVFGYIGELRMEKAKLLLHENKLSIGQISEKVGYKNPQHFSTAFKKKFGVCPSQLKP